jgi:hypothetical protein
MLVNNLAYQSSRTHQKHSQLLLLIYGSGYHLSGPLQEKNHAFFPWLWNHRPHQKETKVAYWLFRLEESKSSRGVNENIFKETSTCCNSFQSPKDQLLIKFSRKWSTNSNFNNSGNLLVPILITWTFYIYS